MFLVALSLGEWVAIWAIVATSTVPGRDRLLAALDRIRPPDTEETTNA